jgi:hypothetical protein
MNDLGNPTAPDHGASDTSTKDLVSGLVSDARDLALAHLDGLRLEAKDELARLASATRFAAIGLALFSIAALLAAFGAAHALDAFTRLPLWASYLVAAALFLAVGGALVLVAKARKRDADAVPEEQLQRAKQDAQWLAGRARNAVT